MRKGNQPKGAEAGQTLTQDHPMRTRTLRRSPSPSRSSRCRRAAVTVRARCPVDAARGPAGLIARRYGRARNHRKGQPAFSIGDNGA
jgi:hypothetical protein